MPEKAGKKAALITDASLHHATPSPARDVNAERGFQGPESFYSTLFFPHSLLSPAHVA